MNLGLIFTTLFGESKRNEDLKSFAKSEYKNDWEFAYNSLRAGQWPESKRR